MKAFKFILAIVVGLPILFFVVGEFLPKSTHIERRIDIAASQGAVFYLVSQHQQFQRWSPWFKLDPNMTLEYSGPAVGVGAKMSWLGDESVGRGTSLYSEYQTNKRAVTLLDFGDMGGGSATYDIEALEGGGSRVVWGFDSENRNVMEKYFGLFLDSILGPIYEDGLLSLKDLAENLEPVVTESIRYDVNGKQFSGYLAYPINSLDPVPGVVIVHGIWGQTEHEQKRARMLAGLGYAALALDLYGNGLTSDDMEEAINLMDEVGENSALTVALFDAAVEQLQNHHAVDSTKIAAVGFSVGGPIVMNMARRGKNLIGVASFYGGFGGLALIDSASFSPTIVFNGAKDPFSLNEQRYVFEREMTVADVPYEIIDYPSAMHGFSDLNSDQIGLSSELDFIRYNQAADEDSWGRFAAFLNKVFYL